MTYRTHLALILLAATLLWQSCDDLSVDPGPFEYPVKLTAASSNSSVSLSWNEVDVSTFTEYIIVRAAEPIPDTPEPELTGTQVIVERIDERDESSYVDFSAPFSEILYYKVFASIGERFLISQTIEVETSVQVIDYRIDLSIVDTDQDELIGFDRVLDILFVYNYEDEEVKAQRQFSWNNPVIKYGNYNGADEIYVTDGWNAVYVLDRETLDIKQQYNANTGIIDFAFEDDLFILALNTGNIEIRRRNGFSFVDDINANSNQRFIHIADKDEPGLQFVEIAFNRVWKFRLNGNTIQKVAEVNDIVSNGQVVTAAHPDGTEFVVNGTGLVLNTDMETRKWLDGSFAFSSSVAYSSEGNRVLTFGFNVNNPVLKFYDVLNDHEKISENVIGINPQRIFADETNAYAVSIVFFNGGVRSVLNTYDLP